MRLVIGLIKGIIIGGLVGFGAYQLGWTGGLNWLTYCLTGALVGLLVGRPFWSHLRDKNSTIWVSVLKTAFGAGIAALLYLIVTKAWSGMDVALMGETRNIFDWQPLMGAALGGIYGAWVEADDAPPANQSAAAQQKKG